MFFDPSRKTRNKPQYRVTFSEVGGNPVVGDITVKNIRHEPDDSISFEVFWHPEGLYRWVKNVELSNVYHLKTKRKIADLAEYYLR